MAKIAQHDAQAVINHPLGVPSLLGHGPGVTRNDHWQAQVDGFAQTGRPRFADEEIGKAHPVSHILREFDNDAWCCVFC